MFSETPSDSTWPENDLTRGVSLSPIAAFARAHDPDRFLAALFAPPERREAFFTLIAFNHELARAREAANHPMAALIRLQWWRDALDEARAGKQARRHEVAAPLHAAITAQSAKSAGAVGALITASAFSPAAASRSPGSRQRPCAACAVTDRNTPASP